MSFDKYEEVELRSCRNKKRFRTGEVYLSRKPGDQTKNSSGDTQIINNDQFSSPIGSAAEI